MALNGDDMTDGGYVDDVDENDKGLLWRCELQRKRLARHRSLGAAMRLCPLASCT